MNILSIISLILAIAVFLLSVITSTNNPSSMLDMHGILIVVGGTVAAGAVSFQLDRLLLMVKVFVSRNIMGKKPNYRQTIIELMRLAESYRNNSADLRALVEESKDDFLKDAMIALMDGIMETERLLEMLKKRANSIYDRYTLDANRFKAMGKYPPAMGLMGAVLGMINLLGGLGTPGAEASVGPAMSVALIATLYGIAIANLVIIPIGENLSEAAKEVRTKNMMIIDGVRLMAESTNPIVLAEELNSRLLPKERIDRKAI